MRHTFRIPSLALAVLLTGAPAFSTFTAPLSRAAHAAGNVFQLPFPAQDSPAHRARRNRNRRGIQGIVTRTLSNDRFEIRTSNGEIVRVQPDNNGERVWVQSGDRVALRGRFQGQIFLATDIQRNGRGGNNSDDNNDYNDGRTRRVNFPAVIVSRDSSTRLTVRGDNGETYVLRSDSTLNRDLRDGARVRVQGVATGLSVRLDTVFRIDTNSDYGNGDYGNGNSGNGNSGNGNYGDGNYGDNENYDGKRVSFPARVERGDEWNQLRVRGDNGRSYLVYVSDASRYAVGQRIRVIGTFRDGVVRAQDIERL